MEPGQEPLATASPETAAPQTARPEPLDFADLPRLELEQAISVLTARAQDVLDAQGRLRKLLRANALVVDELDVDAVMRHVVAAAADLVGARYGAMGVVRDGVIESFVHVGMEPELVARIGGLPRGLGILGLLARHPEPIRLRDLGEHPAAAGFPTDHPRMCSFLGVPVRVRGEAFGNLYLTDSVNGEFSSDDEQLVVALAATAGVAIANAELFDESTRQGRWLAASTELTQQLFAGHDAPLDVVLRHAARGAGADVAVLVMCVDDDHVRVEASCGIPPGLVGQVLLTDGLLAGSVIRSGSPLLADEPVSEFETVLGGRLPVTAAIAVPLHGAENRVLGAMTLGRTPTAPPFTEADCDAVAGFANHAGLAVELDQARVQRDALVLLQDRERIGKELHDHVIAELFAVGIGLQGLMGRLAGNEQRERVEGYVTALDATIRTIRESVYERPDDPGRSKPTG